MRCRVCKSKNLKEVINLGKQPLANKYPKNNYEILSEKKYELKVLFCKTCKAGQISKIIDRNLLFKDYYYLSSVNKKLVEHFVTLSKKLTKYDFVVDIGSNDGILLQPLKKLKINSIGIDPSINVGKIANERGLKTFIGFFNKKIIEKILKKYKKPDLVVASSIITHLKDPIEFAKNIKLFLRENGTLIIEIEYLFNFIKNFEYERFYFDRPFYYSANSIDRLFKNYGMSLYDIEKIDIHGGSLRCYIKNSKNFTKTKRCINVLLEEKNNLKLKKFDEFNKKIKTLSKNLKNKLINLNKKNKYIIGYGAPARVSTITNVCDINSNLIQYIIDDSPLKQNRFSPGKHIPILPKKNNINRRIDIVIVFAFEYFKDIKKNFKDRKVKFYKPIPFKKLL
tara:strand:+ start:113 stop:1297 length:1185 start_codon:yes stop_codon:yes gene_type:complete